MMGLSKHSCMLQILCHHRTITYYATKLLLFIDNNKSRANIAFFNSDSHTVCPYWKIVVILQDKTNTQRYVLEYLKIEDTPCASHGG